MPNESKAKIAQSTQSSILTPTYRPSPTQIQASNRVMNDWIYGRQVCNRGYNYFNGRTLYDVIDDWTTRWNGYIEPLGPLAETSSNIFLNFTRNLIIAYLAKVAMSPVEPKIKAVNRKTHITNQTFSDLLKELNRYSLNEENADAKFLATALEATVKGTAIVYEGYKKTTRKKKVPLSYNAETGKVITRDMEVTDFDNCYQELLNLEDFYIANPFTPNLQDQPFVIWKKITTYYEASTELGRYGSWKYVQPGSFQFLGDPTTFYNEEMNVELQPNQVQIIKYFNRRENLYIIMANNVVMYEGPFPWAHGKYPFAKYIFEPFGNNFFWGAGAPFKFMGEQDTENTFVNMMVDKTYGSLLPYGLSSDLDDLIEDDTLAPNKIRKVGDINKWKFDTLPGIEAGEANMFQTFMNLIRENSGLGGAADQFSPKGGRLNVRQVLLKNQEQIQKIQFNIQYLEDGERDRTELRLKNICQFYSIPKIEKITGKNGKEVEELVYREIVLHDADLQQGKKGTKIIKLVDPEGMDDNERMKLEEELSIIEEMGELQGEPTEAVAIPISLFNDFDVKVQVIKASSYSKNTALEQAEAMDYAKWRLTVAQMGVPTDYNELAAYVDETYDIETDRFTPKEGGMPQGQPGAQPGPVPPEGVPKPDAGPSMKMDMTQLKDIS
jgi:hypothetical protein